MEYYKFTQLLKEKGYTSIRLYKHTEIWEKNGKQFSFPFINYVPMSIVRDVQ